MKKTIITAISIIVCLILSVAVFSESICSFAAGIIFKEKVSSAVVTDTTSAATLKKGDYVYFGKFNGERILWKVIDIDDGCPVLLSERAICFMPFNSGEEVVAGSSSWENSTIRSWLNSDSNETYTFECTPENRIKNDTVTVDDGFLCDENFTAAEIEAISENGDMISLPSKKMISSLPKADRQKSPTVYAVTNDPSPYLHLRKTCWYWTLTPISTNTSSVTAVTTAGAFYKSISNDGLMGVCPVTTLESAEISVCGGDGSVGTPYVFDSEVE